MHHLKTERPRGCARHGRWIALFWAVWASAVSVAGPGSAYGADPMEIAVLEALDKVTGRVYVLDVPMNLELAFGNLRVMARQCLQAPPEETPESTVFMEIAEAKPGEPPELIFQGWMFASSPGLSTLEHPVYDIIVLSCKNYESTDPNTSPVTPTGEISATDPTSGGSE